jgi:hypothetical protein
MQAKTYFQLPECRILKILHPFQGEDNLKKCISKGHICFRIQPYKSCYMSRYTYDMDVHTGKDRTCVAADVIATHATQKIDRKGRGTWM